MQDWRTIPASPKERNILGAAMARPEVLDAIGLVPDDFVDESHKLLWAELLRRRDAGLPGDELSLLDDLAVSGGLDAMGGGNYILLHGQGITTDAYLPTCKTAMAERKQERDLCYALQGGLDEMAEPGHNAHEIAERLRAATETTSQELMVGILEMLDPWIEAKQRQADGIERVYLETGIPGWDGNPDFLGLSKQGVTLVLGASGAGKTSLLNRFALGIRSTGGSVYLHGTETGTKRRTDDLLCSLAGVDSRAWGALAMSVDPKVTPNAHVRQSQVELMGKMDSALAWWRTAPGEVYISGGALTVEEICYRATVKAKRHGLDAVIVDYLQDIADTRGEGLRPGDRVQQVAHKSSMLKDLASRLEIPVIIGAQVSGEKDGPGKDPRPQLWSCQWSSSAHQDAEEVYALHREDYYIDRFGDEWRPTQHGRPGYMEIIARKRRTGSLARLYLDWRGPTKWVGEPIELETGNVIPFGGR